MRNEETFKRLVTQSDAMPFPTTLPLLIFFLSPRSVLTLLTQPRYTQA